MKITHIFGLISVALLIIGMIAMTGCTENNPGGDSQDNNIQQDIPQDYGGDMMPPDDAGGPPPGE